MVQILRRLKRGRSSLKMDAKLEAVMHIVTFFSETEGDTSVTRGPPDHGLRAGWLWLGWPHRRLGPCFSGMARIAAEIAMACGGSLN